jgi:hypothetical protein
VASSNPAKPLADHWGGRPFHQPERRVDGCPDTTDSEFPYMRSTKTVLTLTRGDGPDRTAAAESSRPVRAPRRAAKRGRLTARRRALAASTVLATVALALLGSTGLTGTASAAVPAAPNGTSYGTDGTGNPKTSDCTKTVAAGGSIQNAINGAAAGAVICVKAADYSGASLTIDKAVTVRANGVVKIKSAVLTSGNATLDGFTIVGGAAGTPAAGVSAKGNSNKIVNNLINGHGLQYGISCYQNKCGSGTLIASNTITRINNYGLYMLNGDHITVERNNIYNLYDSVNNGLDVDGIRLFGTSHIIRNNYIHDLNSKLSVSEPHLDCMQHYQNDDGSDRAANITIENNYCVRVSGMCLITKNNIHNAYDLRDYTFRGNVCQTYGWQQVILSGIDGFTMENNTFLGATQGGPNVTVQDDPSGAVSKNIRIRNNIMIRGDSKNASIGNRSGAPIASGDLADNSKNATWVDTSLLDDQAAFNNSPTPVTTPIIDKDFTTFRTESQQGNVLNQGAAMLTSGLTADIDGGARVRGSAVDIGAYEFG